MHASALTLKLMPTLDQTVVREATRANVSKSEWVRRAIVAYAAQQQMPASKPFVSALDLAGDLVGCFEGGPTDLSTNLAYMDGFGKV